MGRGGRQEKALERAVLDEAVGSLPSRSVGVALFGGPADGRRVTVQFLDDPVAIWASHANDLAGLAVDAPSPDGFFLGVYEFVGPRGPERPVFVHRPQFRR